MKLTKRQIANQIDLLRSQGQTKFLIIKTKLADSYFMDYSDNKFYYAKVTPIKQSYPLQEVTPLQTVDQLHSKFLLALIQSDGEVISNELNLNIIDARE